MTRYHWPGNVRELENCIERAVLLCDSDVIRSEHLPPSLQMVRKTEYASRRTMVEIIENMEKELIVDALKKSGGRQRKAAKDLGITERILGYKIKMCIVQIGSLLARPLLNQKQLVKALFEREKARSENK